MAKGLANNASSNSVPAMWAALLLRLFCCVALWAAPGCEAFTPPALSQRFHENSAEAPLVDSAGAGEHPAANNRAEGAAKTTRELFENEQMGWRLAVAASSSESNYRWRHAGLEELLANENAPQAVLSKLARSSSSVTAATAQIGLARLAPAANVAQLTAIVENEQLPQGVRAAALETYASFKTAAAVSQLQQWQSRLTRALRVEWLYALAQQAPPDQHPAFAAAFTAADDEVVIAALAAYVGWKTTPPDLITPLLNSPRSAVRLAALQAVRRGVSAEAYAAVERLSLSLDSTVRREAIAALGRIGDAQAGRKLRQLLQHRGENVRAAALAALAVMQDWEACRRASDDQSWRVRRTLAQTLEHWPQGTQRDQLTFSLLHDASTEVRLALVAAVREWRPQESAPGLFFLLEHDAGRRVQQAAMSAVIEQMPDDDEQAIAVSPSPKTLRKKWQRRFGAIAPLPVAEVLQRKTTPAPTFDAASLDKLEQVLDKYASAELPSARAAARRAMLSLGAALIPQLEALSAARRSTLPDGLYPEVLAKASPLFAAMEQLKNDKISVRQAAALHIAELARSGDWPSLARRRMAELLVREQDVTVWLKLLPLLAGSADSVGITAGFAAMSHPAPQVRRAAAAFLGESPAENREQALASLLDDVDPGVVSAAARALAKNREVGDAAQLRRLLRSHHTETRLAAAVALSRANLAAGKAALERIAHGSQHGAQRDAVVAMGAIGDADFLPTLIQLLDAPAPIRRTALASLKQIVGASAPHSENEFSTDANQADVWRSWFAQQETTETE